MSRIRYAALYIRVSTADQGERYSPGSQREKLLAKAHADGYEVPPEYVFEDHHTGKVTERPALERLRALVKTGAVQAVIVLCIDRLARISQDAAMLAAEFKKHGAVLDFVEMRNDDSPEGKLQFQIMASMAEYMGAKIVERGKDGRRKMMEADLIPGGVPPYGYDRDPAHKGKRIINEREAAVVREVFDLAAGGMPCYAIAKVLNKRGVLSKGWNGHAPMQWSRPTIQKILANHHYRGEYKSKSGRIIPVPRIVSDALFFRAQAALQETGAKFAGVKPKKYRLVKFLWDSYGIRMHGKAERNNRLVYVSNNRNNKPPVRVTSPAVRVSAPHLEKIACAAIWEMVTEPEVLRSNGRAYYDSLPKAQPDGKAAQMERELAKLKRTQANRRQMYKDGEEEYTAEARDEMRDMTRRIAFLQSEIHAIEPIRTLPPDEVIEGWCREIREAGPPTTYEGWRGLLEAIPSLKLVYSEKDGEAELEIHGQIPVGADYSPDPEDDSTSGVAQKSTMPDGLNTGKETTSGLPSTDSHLRCNKKRSLSSISFCTVNIPFVTKKKVKLSSREGSKRRAA